MHFMYALVSNSLLRTEMSAQDATRDDITTTHNVATSN